MQGASMFNHKIIQKPSMNFAHFFFFIIRHQNVNRLSQVIISNSFELQMPFIAICLRSSTNLLEKSPHNPMAKHFIENSFRFTTTTTKKRRSGQVFCHFLSFRFHVLCSINSYHSVFHHILFALGCRKTHPEMFSNENFAQFYFVCTFAMRTVVD